MLYKKILVILNKEHKNQTALEHATSLAHKTGASLELFVCASKGFNFAEKLIPYEQGVKTYFVEQAKEWLETLAEPLRDEGLAVTTDARIAGPRFVGMVEKVLEGGHDLMIKTARVHSLTETVFFTPTDWNLLRKSPVPVMLAKPRDWRPNGKIIAAVDAMRSNDKPAKLNRKIIDHALAWAEQVGADVHVVHAYNSLLPYLNAYAAPGDIEDHKKAIAKKHQVAFDTLLSHYDFPKDHVHMMEGLPSEVIAHLVDKLDAELVVMGTISRAGMQGIFVGNTAEDVLDEINCDVLALKPEGFVSPLVADKASEEAESVES